MLVINLFSAGINLPAVVVDGSYYKTCNSFLRNINVSMHQRLDSTSTNGDHTPMMAPDSKVAYFNFNN